MPTPVQTPWGPAQFEKGKAEGIVFYSTAGHGGYKLSPERHAHVVKQIPGFTTFAGGAWYEEDCDLAVVVLVFNELYTATEVFNAIRSARMQAGWSFCATNWGHVVQYIESRTELLAIEHREKERTSKLWEHDGLSGGMLRDEYRDLWVVYLGRGEERKALLMPYPMQQFYTDEELAGFAEYDAEKHNRPRPQRAAAVQRPTPIPVFREEDCGGAFDGFGVTSDADSGL